MYNPGPHDVTEALERDLCRYTGATFAVALNSCTNAVQLALMWHRWTRGELTISLPARTYPGIAHAVINAGHRLSFYKEDWVGEYQLLGSNVWDSAKRFTSGFYRPGMMQCISAHVSKILGASQGGAILLDDAEAAAFLRRARFDGRTAGVPTSEDSYAEPAMHAYLSPGDAAQIRWKLSTLPAHNPDQPMSDYPDLSTHSWFISPMRAMARARRKHVDQPGQPMG